MSLTILHVEAGRNLYGGALQVTYLLQGLAPYGLRNVLVCPPGAAIARHAQGIAEVYEVPLAGDADVGFISRLQRVIRNVKPDIVHLHSRRGADLWGGLAARRAGVPVVLSRRVDNPEPAWWARYKYRLYDRVITISQGIRAVLLHAGVDATRVVCVPSAVDTQRFQPQADHAWFAQEFGLTPGQPVVAMIAQLIPRKGHRYLLAALPQILQAVPQARFLIFGQGPLEDELRHAIAAAGLEEVVRWCGFREDLARILPCLNLVVHPAEMEGLGVSLLQAAACGIPIVASAVGGIPEVVRHEQNGLLVAAGDVPALAADIRHLLLHPDVAATFGKSGRALVEREFSLAAMVAGNLRVYQEILGLKEIAPPGLSR